MTHNPELLRAYVHGETARGREERMRSFVEDLQESGAFAPDDIEDLNRTIRVTAHERKGTRGVREHARGLPMAFAATSVEREREAEALEEQAR